MTIQEGNANRIKIIDPKGDGLIAIDHNNDGRFEIILLEYVPKGSPLEQFANPDKLGQAYRSVQEQNSQKGK